MNSTDPFVVDDHCEYCGESEPECICADDERPGVTMMKHRIDKEIDPIDAIYARMKDIADAEPWWITHLNGERTPGNQTARIIDRPDLYTTTDPIVLAAIEEYRQR